METVLWDLDGTLIDSMEVVISSFQEALKPYLKRCPGKDEVLSLFGPPEEKIMEAVLPEPESKRCLLEYYGIYRKNLQMIRVFPGVLDLLAKLSRAGIKNGVVTAKGRKMTELTLEYLKLERLVDTVVTGSDVRKTKPSPEGIYLALRQLEGDKRRTVYVGDSPLDVLAGKAAGVVTAAALWGTRQSERLLDAGPDYVFSDIRILGDWLLDSPP